MKKYTLMAALCCAPLLSFASDIGEGLRCNLSAVDFFQPLIQRKIIPSKPYSLQGVISYFHPKIHFIGPEAKGLTAFGMRVDSVFGYASGQVIFTKQEDWMQSPNLYGVLVREQIGNVQAQLNSMNVTRAKTRLISHDITEIICIEGA